MFSVIKKLLILSVVFCSCSNSIYQYKENNVGTNQPEQGHGTACPNPTFIATETAFTSGGIDGFSSNLWMANLLLQAKKKYGEGVTIQNVHWDTLDGKRVAATFDVVNCVEGIIPVRK